MAKICCNCHEKIGFRSGIELPDWNYLCDRCYMAIPPHMRDNIEYINAENYKQCVDYWDNRFSEFYPVFHPQFGEPGYLEIDPENRLWRIPVQSEMSEIFMLDEILDFKLCEDGEVIQNNGIGRAIVGGMIAGGTGAVIGGVTGIQKKSIQEMYVNILLDNPWIKSIKILLINHLVRTTDFEYSESKDIANRILSCLLKYKKNEDSAIRKGENEEIPTKQLFDLKKLLDAGIITKEEFNLKKKQILGI